jgi:hypothetical protein
MSKECGAFICTGQATTQCKVCSKPICSRCAALKYWARGCCPKNLARAAWKKEYGATPEQMIERHKQYGPLNDEVIDADLSGQT